MIILKSYGIVYKQYTYIYDIWTLVDTFLRDRSGVKIVSSNIQYIKYII